MTETRMGLAGKFTPKKRGPTMRTRESLDAARDELRRLLRARIAVGERELAALRTELAGIGASHSRTARRSQVCSACGKPGHTKRTCADGAASHSMVTDGPLGSSGAR